MKKGTLSRATTAHNSGERRRTLRAGRQLRIVIPVMLSAFELEPLTLKPGLPPQSTMASDGPVIVTWPAERNPM